VDKFTSGYSVGRRRRAHATAKNEFDLLKLIASQEIAGVNLSIDIPLLLFAFDFDI
jgi:hypothetical protein